MDQSATLAVLVACAVLLVAAGFLLRGAARAREERLRHFVGQFREDAAPLGEEEPRTTWRQGLAKRLNRFLAHRDFVQATRLDLLRAGLQVSPTRFFRLRVMLALGGALVLGLLLRGQLPLLQLVGTLGGLVGGYLLVRPLLSRKQRKRHEAFEKHFADALDVMVGGLESGASLTATVELVGREMPPPISTEFSRVLRDAGLGVSYEEAFKAMHERLPSDDLGMFVSAISVHFRVGGNLASVLRTLGATVRDRLRIRGDVKTLTAQQRLTGWIISIVPFAVVAMLFITGRSYMIQVLEPGLARTLALVGMVMILTANVIIRRILRIEV